MRDNPLISIIIPVYNVEKYLEKCLDSIIKQTYKHLEIILVDDGSTDSSGVICDKYAIQDYRISVIHKMNGGLSDARNYGLQVMTGEYLMFVDSDDWISIDAVENLYKLAITNQAELVIGNYIRIYDEKKEYKTNSGNKKIQVLDSVEAMEYMFQNGCASWARLYKHNIHKDILFPKGEINEDEAIVLLVLEKCRKIVITDVVVYYYRCRRDSITTSYFSNKKLDWKVHCADNLRYVREKHPSLIPVAIDRYRGSLLWSLTEIALSDQKFHDEIKELVIELRNNRKEFKEISFKHPQNRVRMFILMYLPFGFYRKLLRIKRKLIKNGE